MTLPPVYPVYIYTLVDPRTDEVRYVGQTKFPKLRLQRHMMPSFIKRPGHKNKWLRQLQALNLIPRMDILEVVDTLTWVEAETRHIAAQRALGARLTNLTDGGEGTLGWIPTPETRRKIAKANTGHVPTAETLAKLSLSHRGLKRSAETCAKLSAAKMGWVMPAEGRQKLSQWRKGRKLPLDEAASRRAQLDAMRADPAMVAKREAARIPATKTPEFAAKTSAFHKGRPKSADHRRKIGEAGRATKARQRAEKRAVQESMQLCLFSKPPLDDWSS